MTWLMISPIKPEIDGEDVENGESVMIDGLDEIALPEPLRFKVKELSVAERREYRAKAEEMSAELDTMESIGPMPAEDADSVVQTDYSVRVQQLTRRMSKMMDRIRDHMIETYVVEIEGYESVDDLDDFYLDAMQVKIADFLQARRNLGWKLVAGTALAKPSKGRK